jgi:predicted secreted hydrolase
MKTHQTTYQLTKQSLSAAWLLAVALFVCLAGRAEEISKLTPDGFAIPQPGRQFIFPRDHGSHPEFAIEWWYVTGHLTATGQTQFGFQATFFRRALVTPGATNNSPSAAFGSSQIYLAHMALVNKNTGEFKYQEKLNRDGWDAYASINTLDVRNGNWSLRLTPRKTDTREVFELQGTIGADAAFALNLMPKKPLVIFGTNGVSRKAADPGAASHYLTFPRLAASGTLTLEETNLAVTGEAWMDHEFSSSQLGAGQVGWDWLSLQLFDGRELMAYRMRRSDGSTDPFSTVAWIDAAGEVRQIGPDQFKWTTLDHWRSRKTGADYPSLVRLEAANPATAKPEVFLVQPFVANQELAGKTGGVSYWEGACRVLDERQHVIGQAYMELTGYSENLKGKF